MCNEWPSIAVEAADSALGMDTANRALTTAGSDGRRGQPTPRSGEETPKNGAAGQGNDVEKLGAGLRETHIRGRVDDAEMREAGAEGSVGGGDTDRTTSGTPIGALAAMSEARGALGLESTQRNQNLKG